MSFPHQRTRSSLEDNFWEHSQAQGRRGKSSGWKALPVLEDTPSFKWTIEIVWTFTKLRLLGALAAVFTLVNLTPVCCCRLHPSLWTSGSGTPPPILTEIIEVIVALISACHSVRNLFKISLFQTKKRKSTSYYDCVKRLIPSLFKGTTLSVRSSCYLSCSHRIKRSNGRFSTLA